MTKKHILVSSSLLLALCFTCPMPAGAKKSSHISASLYRALKGNLVSLKGKKARPFNDRSIIKKDFLAFYFSAHWCGPCRAFTPKLVRFYNDNKADSFEIIFVSSDRSDGDMQKYMYEAGMPWPAIKYGKIQKTGIPSKYAGRGIPCLVLIDAKTGEVLSDSYVNGRYVGPSKVMEYLKNLLNRQSAKPSETQTKSGPDRP